MGTADQPERTNVSQGSALQVPTPPEPYVPAETAADFLSITPRRVKELARAGKIPAYRLGYGQRRIWRFRLSEIASALLKQPVRQSVDIKPAGRRNRSTKG
jgi:excisionase family DNA binding protein